MNARRTRKLEDDPMSRPTPEQNREAQRRFIERLRADPDKLEAFKRKERRRQRIKYAADPAFAERKRTLQKERYSRDPEVRAQLAALNATAGKQTEKEGLVMHAERKRETLGGSTKDSGGARIPAAQRDRRNLTLTAVNTRKLLGNLNSLLDGVMSGEEYNAEQARDASNLAATMIKVMRFEFDVYKHFVGNRPPIFEDVSEPPDGVQE